MSDIKDITDTNPEWEKVIEEVSVQAPEQKPQNIVPEFMPPIEEKAEPEKESVQPKRTDKQIEIEANMGLAFIDFTQSNVFRGATVMKRNNRIKKLYGMEGMKIKEKVELLENGSGLTDEKEIGVYSISKRADKIIASLPLSQDEKDLLAEPLKKYVEAHGGVLPPEFMMWMSALQIFGGRLLNVWQW